VKSPLSMKRMRKTELTGSRYHTLIRLTNLRQLGFQGKSPETDFRATGTNSHNVELTTRSARTETSTFLYYHISCPGAEIGSRIRIFSAIANYRPMVSVRISRNSSHPNYPQVVEGGTCPEDNNHEAER
jgi:hypothetical protein